MNRVKLYTFALFIILTLSLIILFFTMPQRVAVENWGFWEVLIGILSAALTVLAILIGFATLLLYFWGKDWLEKVIQERVETKAKAGQDEADGKLLGLMGFLCGRLAEKDQEFIHLAIKYSQDAYESLPEGNPFKVMAMNNAAFYYARRGYVTDAETAIKLAKALLEDYSKSRDIDWLTTYAAVVGRYYKRFERPKQVLMDAEEMMNELLVRADVAPGHKQNAERHLGAIRSAQKELG